MSRFIALIILPLLAVSTFANEPDRFQRILRQLNNPSGNAVLVVAHRGDWREFPENTIEAILGAAEIGVDIVEIDVKKTKDGQYIVMHDKTVDRTTGGKGLVSDLTLEEIKKLKIKAGNGALTHYKVPTLKEAFVVSKGRVVLALDRIDLEWMDDIYALAEKTCVEKQIVFLLAYKTKTHVDFKFKAPEAWFAQCLETDREDSKSLFNQYEQQLKPMAYVTIPTKNPSLDQTKIVQVVRESGRHIWCNSFNVDDKAVHEPNAWKYTLDRGATIIQTDRPSRLIRYLEEQKRRL